MSTEVPVRFLEETLDFEILPGMLENSFAAAEVISKLRGTKLPESSIALDREQGK